MHRIFCLAFFCVSLLFCSSCGLKKRTQDCFQVYSDTIDGEILYGFKKAENIQIKAKYLATYTDEFCHMALVLASEKGWVGIDKNDQIVLVPFMYDNGPDYLQEGLFRFLENNKMGFADSTGKKEIPAQFDFVTPFSNGYALYYIGGEKIYQNGKTEAQIMEEGTADFGDLHWSWGGEVIEKGYINKKGEKFKDKLGNNAHQ